MVKNAKTLTVAGLVVVIGIVLIVAKVTIPGLIVALLGIVGLFLVMRAPAEEAGKAPEPAPRPSAKASTAVIEEVDEIELTEEPDGSWDLEETSSWDVEATTDDGDVVWEAGGTDTWEAEATDDGEVTWEAETTDTWEAEASTEDDDVWTAETTDTWEAEASTEDDDVWGADEVAETSSGASGLFSVASPIDENVESADDIMAASQATELHVEDEDAGGDNSELAKLLAKVQSRLAAYE